MHSALFGLFLALLPTGQQSAPVQVLRIAAGPAGSDSNGAFVLSEERSVFSRSTDREVIVFFQWEDLPGPHKLVAQWRSPDGGASVTSAIDYSAREKRFGAYWKLPVTPAIALGTWSIEVTMDGRPAGRFTFEITGAPVVTPLAKRPLTEAEVYERLNGTFVVLRRSSADGRELDPAAAFMVTPGTGQIYTVIPALDSADTVRAVMADRTIHELTRLVAFNRPQQWAILEAPPAPGQALPVRSEAVKIGSRCFSMEGTADGVRVLVGGTITGQAATVAGQPVVVATFPSAFGMPGAPVLDEYGELFGMLGAGMPGDSRPVEHIVAARGDLKGAPVIPFSLVSTQPTAAPVSLAALRATGSLMPSVVGGGQVASGGFTRAAVKRGDTGPTEFVEDFSVRDKLIGILLNWAPAERLRGQAVLLVFDADNKLLAASAPRKVDFRKGDYVRSTWQVPAPAGAGRYRIDVLIGANTYWRGVLRINP